MNICHIGDCLTILPTLEAGSVQTCVTSPPYFGLRDYQTAKWEGGDPACDHRSPTMREGRNEDRPKLAGSDATNAAQLILAHRTGCGKCGAIKVDSQIGLEATPEEYIAKMVDVFRAVRRVLRDDGTLWVNIGDSYSSGGRGSYGTFSPDCKQATHAAIKSSPRPSQPEGIKAKDLIGIPWMLAFALRADGWYLRQDIIWHKPNPMPESVRDRCTKAHEYIFLLSKSERYYFDADAIAEEAIGGIPGNVSPHKYEDKSIAPDGNYRMGGGLMAYAERQRTTGRPGGKKPEQFDDLISGAGRSGVGENSVTRNKRSVWTVTTKPFSGAHFATFPPDLIEPCILAGSKPGDLVLDPFMGSGTTAIVAQALGRQWVGCELNPAYEALQRERTAQQGMVFA